MRFTLPLALLLIGCGGSDALLLHYTVNIHVTAADWVGEDDARIVTIPPCANAEVFDQTLVVYDGMIANPVAALTLSWGGIDLTNGGDNAQTFLLSEGEDVPVYAALQPDLLLYDFDWKGRMLELDRNVADVKKRSETQLEYALGLGGGLGVTEHHVLADEPDEVFFINEGVYSCDVTN